MPVRPVQRDAALVGTLQTWTCTVATPQETTLASGSYLTLPTAEPATPQFSYTIATSDMPVVSGGTFRIVPALAFAGFWTSGAGTTLSYRYERVRGGVTTSLLAGAVPAAGTNNYFTSYIAGNTSADSVVGDTVQLKVWAPAGVVADMRWYALQVLPTRMVPHLTGAKTYADMTLTFDRSPAMLGGVTPTIASSPSHNIHPFDTVAATTATAVFNQTTIAAWCVGETLNYGLGRTSMDSNDTASAQGTLVRYPLYRRFYFPSLVTYRLTAL